MDLLLNRIPVLGIICFACLYYYASTLYPGGSQADLHSDGFDWVHNYWCNLMNEKGGNGQINTARRMAIFAMMLLCVSLSVFFVQFAQFFTTDPTKKIKLFVI